MEEKQITKGIHYMDTFFDCKIENDLLNQPSFFKEKITSKIKEVGLNVVGYAEKKFDIGFTAVWLLEESHISVHTWPELFLVDLDIYVCNYKSDNSEKARLIHVFLKELFKPQKNKLMKINR